MILIIDNYDSFTYNLYQLVGSLNPDVSVVRNDAITVEDVAEMRPSHIILSPGPGRPADAGITEQVICAMAGKCAILGVCLGHQAIGEAFGAQVGHAEKLMHGKQDTVYIANGSELFTSLPPVIQSARYHSLAVLRNTLPDELLVIAESDGGEVMGIKHIDYDIYGIQFHPESILTPCGETILANFLQIGERHD